MRIRFFKICNLKEKRLVETTLGRTFEGNQVGIVAGSLDEIKLNRLLESLENEKKGERNDKGPS